MPDIEKIFELAPNLGASSPEPTLREILCAYYGQVFSEDLSVKFTQGYIDQIKALVSSSR